MLCDGVIHHTPSSARLSICDLFRSVDDDDENINVKNICRAVKVTKLGGRKEPVIQFSIAANLAPRVKLEQESPRDHSKLLSPPSPFSFFLLISFTFCCSYMIMYRQKTTLSCFLSSLCSHFFFYIVSYTFCCSKGDGTT